MSEKTHDVFVSYAGNDKNVAFAVCHGLESDGLRCWIAPRDITPGGDFPSEIVNGISGARAFVIVFSGASNGSRHVAREVHHAAESRMPLVPFRLEDARPTGRLSYYLSATHWMDALDPPLERHIENLAGVLRNLIGLVDGPAPARPQPEPVPNAVTEPPSILIEPDPVPEAEIRPARKTPVRSAKRSAGAKPVTERRWVHWLAVPVLLGSLAWGLHVAGMFTAPPPAKEEVSRQDPDGSPSTKPPAARPETQRQAAREVEARRYYDYMIWRVARSPAFRPKHALPDDEVARRLASFLLKYHDTFEARKFLGSEQADAAHFRDLLRENADSSRTAEHAIADIQKRGRGLRVVWRLLLTGEEWRRLALLEGE